MSMRYKGGVISATPPTTSASSAVGVWTLEQQLQATAGSGWPKQVVSWLATFGNTASNQAQGISIDPSGNVFIVGYGVVGSTNDVIVAKFDNLASNQWQKTIGGNPTTSSEFGYGITLDSSQNVYLAGVTDQGVNNDALLIKYNSSGVIQWQRVLGGAGAGDTGYSVVTDTSGNVYFAGFTGGSGSGSTDILIAKYNSSGTLQWQRVLGGTADDQGNGIAIDSSSNVYVTGYANISSNYEIILCKYNSSGAIQWQRSLSGSGIEYGNSVYIDSSDNVYITGQTSTSTAGSYDVLIAKYNSSGTLQWQRRLGGAGVDIGYGIAIDSSNNLYVCGDTTSSGAGSADFLIAKYDSSGVIQWQRTLGGASGDRGYSIAVGGSSIYVAGITASSGAGSNDALIAKLPQDGTPTGTYGSFTYQASTFTDAASSLTSATSSLTDAAGTLTSSTSTLTDATSSFTTTVTQV